MAKEALTGTPSEWEPRFPICDRVDAQLAMLLAQSQYERKLISEDEYHQVTARAALYLDANP